jgi:hypothetical protein
MSVFACLFGKVAAGLVDRDAAQRLRDWIEERQAALADAQGAAEAPLTYIALNIADDATRAAARRADLAIRTIQAQLATLEHVRAYDAKVKELRATPGDFGFGSKAPLLLADERKSTLWPALRAMFWRDPHEIATGGNVYYLAKTIKGEAHALFAETMEGLRAKMLGLRRETAREADVLAAAYGEASATPEGRAMFQGFERAAKSLLDQQNAAGGAIPERKGWRLPNPPLDRAKVAAVSKGEFVARMRELNSREDVIDFATGRPLDDAGFDAVMGAVHDNAVANWVDGPPTAEFRGGTMLANQHRDPRIIVLKDAASWQTYAREFGEHDSVFDAMVSHIASRSEEIAMLRTFGPNPEGWRRYALSLLDRETRNLTLTAPEAADDAAKLAALKVNRKGQDRLARHRRAFETSWAHVSGTADIPVNTAFAHTMGDMRSVLVGSQMGSAIISSISDTGTLAMAARFNGMPVMSLISRAVRDMAEAGSEVRAAQHGLVADAMAQGIHAVDRFAGETIRAGRAGQMAGAVVRASGLRRWSAALRNSFGLEMMATLAREVNTPFPELEPRLRESLERYGVGAEDWALIRRTPLHEERPNAFLLRPMDVRAQGGDRFGQAADKLKRLIDTEMDHAVIEGDPMTRALLYGDSRPGTVEGEARRAFGLYKSFPITFITLHFARAMARGWDGSRLSHAGITFAAMWALGIVAMQAKQIANGRDPYSLDPATFKGARALAAGMLQGGGAGIFGDLIGQDQTRYGTSLVATLAGAQFGAAEKVGKFVIGNLQRLGRGEETHFAGDALYTAAGFVPGSSLWYGRLAFQRGVVDQMALLIDPRSPERFRRIEEMAQRDYGQRFWLRPGQTTPDRSPDFGAMLP